MSKTIFSTSIAFIVTASLVFLCLGLFGIARHEMWRDEIDAWMAARNSSSVLELLSNVRYNGHPLLWYLILYILSHFTNSLFCMQALHLIIAFFSVFIFLSYSPFSRLQKVLFSFGYFPFYEYAIKSRNYGIGIFLIFLLCAIRDFYFFLLSYFYYARPISLGL
jgi:hypothetical protein